MIDDCFAKKITNSIGGWKFDRYLTSSQVSKKTGIDTFIC